MAFDPGVAEIVERYRAARTAGAEESEATDLKVRITPGIVLAGVVTGAAMALGSGLINGLMNRYLWKK